MKLQNIWHAVTGLLMPPKAMPLTDEWLRLNEKELSNYVGNGSPTTYLKVSKTIEPVERNSSSLRSVKERRQFNTTTKNTLK